MQDVYLLGDAIELFAVTNAERHIMRPHLDRNDGELRVKEMSIDQPSDLGKRKEEEILNGNS